MHLVIIAAILAKTLLSTIVWSQAPVQAPVEVLIKKLGSPRFHMRDAATEKLKMLWPIAIKPLKRALASPDAEVVRRAGLVLEHFEQRKINRLKHFIEQGKVDLTVELFAHWPEGEYEDACWQQARVLIRKFASSFKKPENGVTIKDDIAPPIRFCGKRITKGRRPGDGWIFVRATEVKWGPREAGFSSGRIIFASGNVETLPAFGFASGSIFCGHSVYIEGSTADTIIVADGDVTVRGAIRNCVIVARGQVEYSQQVRIPSTVVRGKDNALGFIQFFNPTKEGITVEQAKNAVRIKQVAAKKPYAKAGLKKGDVLTSINGAKITSPENFRRVLRKHVAWEEEMTFRVVRGGKELQIKLRPFVLP